MRFRKLRVSVLVDSAKGVRPILLEEWDPLHVREIGAPEDEYDQYAFGVALLLRRGADEPQLAGYLGRSRTDAMGAGPDPAADLLTARRILTWYRGEID